MKKIYTYILTTAVIVVGSISLTACGTKQEADKELKIEAVDNKIPSQTTYQVAMDANYPPYEFRDEKGKPIGFEVELLEAIAKNQKFNVNITPTPWSLLIKGLEKQEYSIVIGGISGEDLEGKGNYLISNPHIYGQDVIATLSKNKDSAPRSFEALKGHKVVTLDDSSWVTDLEEITSKDNIVTKKSSFLALQQLIQGNGDVMLNDRDVVKYYQDTIPEFPLTLYAEGDYFVPYAMNIVISQGHQDIVDKINTGLSNIIKSGEYTQIYKKWFHEEPIKIPEV